MAFRKGIIFGEPPSVIFARSSIKYLNQVMLNDEMVSWILFSLRLWE